MRGAAAMGLLAGLTLALPGCSTTTSAPDALPGYAAPQGRLLESSEELATDVIGYRQLERGDFRGEEPPAGFAAYRDRLGAATCAYVVSRPETRFELRELPGSDAASRWRAQPVGLGFVALMDRRCSWWNGEQTHLPPEYVLEHEQIHFALFELEARRLDASAEALARAATATAGRPDEAVQRARAVIEAQLADALEQALRRNRDFDEDTSMGFRPDRQEAWRERVRAELARSDPKNEENPP